MHYNDSIKFVTTNFHILTGLTSCAIYVNENTLKANLSGMIKIGSTNQCVSHVELVRSSKYDYGNSIANGNLYFRVEDQIKYRDIAIHII